MTRTLLITILSGSLFFGCSKKSDPAPQPPIAGPFNQTTIKINGQTAQAVNNNTSINAVVKFTFNNPVNRTTVNSNVSFVNMNGAAVTFTVGYENGDSTLFIQPSASLQYLTKYSINITQALQSVAGRGLTTALSLNFATGIDSTSKFPVISDSALLDKIEQQTFKYFWDFGHPVSGLARERNSSGETITSGGSGFGIMAIPVAVKRNFISRSEAVARLQKITTFLKNTAQTFHGAYPHWLNGTDGTAIAFSMKDNGADLVETSYLMQGLLCARQYFNGTDAAETTLRADINTIYNRVEWDWFRQNNQDVLYWHWSPDFNWDMNVQIKGWNECLITYVMGASSTTHPVPATVYSNGWAGGTGFTNGNSYYGYQLPLGPQLGGPLFFEHYSFLGINPTGLSDAYANYATQTKNHTLINYSYCVANPLNYFGYSNKCWGLTASDIRNGYTASSPTNDVGVIAPTAALSSLPYTPTESMAALKFYYYVLGDKLFKDYGFVDAFSLNELWFADSFLAIDQGPIIIMLENYRSGLLWNLFTSCPEVKAGMRTLGFSAPYL